MKRAGGAAFSGLMLLAAVSAAGTSPLYAAPAYAALPVADAYDDLAADFAKVDADVQAGRFQEALKRIDRILKGKLAKEPEQRATFLSMRAILLAGLDRRAEAEAALTEAESLDAGAEIVVGTRFNVAVMVQDLDRATTALRGLATRYPQVLRTFDSESVLWPVRATYQLKRVSESDRIALMLVRADYAADEPDTRNWLNVAAIRALMAADELGPAAAIALSLGNASSVMAVLTERRYARLWEPVEAQLTPGLANVHTRAIEAAERVATASPDSAAARLGLFSAYEGAGRIADADALGAKVGATREAMAALDEQDGWLVNNYAQLLRDRGRGAEAEARFAAMRAIRIEEKPWLINMIINRLGDVVQAGNWKQALALDTEAGALAADYGSPYAQQLVRALSLCARHRGQPGGDIAALLAAVKAKADDAPLATLDALICLGQLDAAETIWIDAFQSDQWREQAIERMQPAAARQPENATVWDEGRDQLRARPAVQAAFAKVGRVLPERFWYAAKGRD